MILVRLYTREADLLTEVGRLEFYGVPVMKADSSAWIEFDDLGEPRPGQIRLNPPSIVTGAEIKVISHALHQNELWGQAGRYEWRVQERKHNHACFAARCCRSRRRQILETVLPMETPSSFC